MTDRGLGHARNEDAVALAREACFEGQVTILVVCDGVSSSQEADQASALAAQTACDALVRFVSEGNDPASASAMGSAIREAHAALCTQAVSLAATEADDRDPPGTTIVAVLVQGPTVTLGWVGASRAYWVGPDGYGLLTHDHSWVNEVVDSGQMSEAAASHAPQAHALTHCIGALEREDADAAPEPATATFTVPPNCRLLLCSDGLWNYASRPDQMAEIVRAVPGGASSLSLCRTLVDDALACGGQDNVTAAALFLP
ncbi:MAG: PP2C family protein-serine/threonine phosphatase [Dehalococcoidia bacterium]